MSSIIKCDPRARARCPFKNPCCGDEVAYFMDGSDCDKFNRSVLALRPTNADHIRAMSDEELSEFLAYTWGASKAWKNDAGEVLYWLRQPVEEGKP